MSMQTQLDTILALRVAPGATVKEDYGEEEKRGTRLNLTGIRNKGMRDQLQPKYPFGGGGDYNNVRFLKKDHF